ncbi:hypothetical protein MY4038_003425 [Beauveria bassiana]
MPTTIACHTLVCSITWPSRRLTVVARASNAASYRYHESRHCSAASCSPRRFTRVRYCEKCIFPDRFLNLCFNIIILHKLFINILVNILVDVFRNIFHKLFYNALYNVHVSTNIANYIPNNTLDHRNLSQCAQSPANLFLRAFVALTLHFESYDDVETQVNLGNVFHSRSAIHATFIFKYDIDHGL